MDRSEPKNDRDAPLPENGPEPDPAGTPLPLKLIGAAAVILYPLAVYFGARHGRLREAALLAALLILPVVALRMKGSGAQAARWMAFVPLLTACMLLAGAALNSAGLTFYTPVAVNALLFVGFASTLVRTPPMVERFARLHEDTLTDAQIRWCRLWTYIWSAFFVLNGGVAGYLAATQQLHAWTLFTSLISYVLIGALFAVEYAIRRIRFH